MTDWNRIQWAIYEQAITDGEDEDSAVALAHNWWLERGDYLHEERKQLNLDKHK